MPNILIKIPKDTFTPEHRKHLIAKINEAAATAEQIPNEASKRFFCWVVIEEVELGSWTCGGVDMTAHIIPCIAVIYLPAGVLDAASRSSYVELVHAAFKQALPESEKRQLSTSVMLHDVVDGTWGANGAIWKLPTFAKAVGFTHLQSLLTDA